jgi:uncharacterized protein YidB (DUF937 family)
MGLLSQVLTGVVASRMGGGMGGAFGGPLGGALGGGLGRGGGLGGALGGAVLGGAMGGRGGRGSPVMKALLLLLAAKAARDYMGRRSGAGAGAGFGQGGGMGGGMGGGGLGGLLGGVAGGGGLGALVEQFNRTGHGDAINSWIGRGPNKPLPPQQLAEALGPDTVRALTQETGLPQDEVLEELSQTLPDAVDQLSPEGVAPDPSALEGDDEDLEHLRAAP